MNPRTLTSIFCLLLIATLPLTSAQGDIFSTPSGFDYATTFGTPPAETPQYATYSQASYPGLSGLESAFYQRDVSSPFVRWRESIYSTVFGPTIDLGEGIVVNVADYEPKVIRASLLEKQDVPVFVKLEGISPECAVSRLAGSTEECLPPIREVIITLNQSNPFVRGANQIRPRIGGFSLNNLGGMLIFLTRIRNESALPPNNTIPIDFTARIILDNAKSILGVSEHDLWLPQQSEDHFLKEPDKSSNAIFARRGYIRASAIDAETASFVVYNKDLTPISFFAPPEAPAGVPVATMRLRKGQASRPVRLGYSGNILQDTFVVRLNNILTPNDYATITVSAEGKNFELRPIVNERLFPTSRWRVRSVSKHGPTETTREALRQRFPTMPEKLYDDLSDIKPLLVEDHTLELQHVESGDRKTLTRTLVLNKDNTLALKLEPPNDLEAEGLEQRYCPNLNPAADPLDHDYACQAMQRLKTLLTTYPGSNEVQKAYELLATIAENYLIDYPACDIIKGKVVRDAKECGLFQHSMNRLAYYYYAKAGRDDRLGNLEHELTSFGGVDFLPDDGVTIRLTSITKITEQERGSVKLSVDGIPIERDLVHYQAVPGLDGTQDTQQTIWNITAIHPNSVTLERQIKDKGNLGYLDSLSLNLNQEHEVIISQTTSQGTPGVLPTETKKRVKLTDLQINNYAHVTIVPAAGRSAVTSNFRVYIGIDERPFKLTPEQLQDKIQATKNLIAQLDDIIKKMDALVQGWKKVCLVTFGVITAKNALSGGGSRAIARRTVHQFYKDKCTKEVNALHFKIIDDCLASYTEHMQADIDTHQQAIDAVNAKLKGATPSTLKECGDITNFQNLQKTGVTADQCKDYLRLQALEQAFKGKKDKEEQLEFLRTNTIDLTKKNEAYHQALAMVKGNDKIFAGYTNEEEKVLAAYRMIEDAKTEGKTSQGITTVPNMHFDPNKPNEAFAVTTTLKDGNLEAPTKINFARVTQLQYLLWTGQLKTYLDTAMKNAEIDTGTSTPDQLALFGASIKRDLTSQYAVDPLGNRLFVDKENALTEVDTRNAGSYANAQDPSGILGEITAIGKDGLAFSQTTPSEIKLYTSVTELGPSGTIRATNYAPTGVKAEFGKTDGLAVCYPTGENGNYILVNRRYANNRVENFEIWNVGFNRVIECGKGDDDPVYRYEALKQNQKLYSKYEQLINSVPRCTKEGEDVRAPIQGLVNLEVTCSFQQDALANAILQPKCTEVMEPSDCKFLFNVCDPVMCPPSRCNLGGRYPVQDVIQTGIVGSAVLCLPNAKQGIAVPVCLTGILAGLKAIKSLLEGYQGCLEIKLEKGENVGFCDYVRSVGTCELLWRQLLVLFDLRGGIIDWLSAKLGGPEEGGTEYLTFHENFKNVGNSFNYFTSEYSTTALAYYKGKGTEFGSQICQLSVRGKIPTLGDILDKLSEPEDPPQFEAFFDEAPYIQSAGEPLPLPGTPITSDTKEYSLYRIFYHIYAGTGYATEQGILTEQSAIPGAPNKPVRYTVYLQNQKLGLPRLYVVDPERPSLTERSVERGSFAQETVQRVAPKGYNEICVIVNGKPACGFGKASTSFAVNYINDQVVKGETLTKITTAEQCIGNPEKTSATLGAVGVGAGLLGAPIETAGLAGLSTSFTNTGIVRVCNPVPPTIETTRWVNVGNCGNDAHGKTLGTCWLDRTSVSVKDVELQKELQAALFAIEKKGVTPDKFLSAEDSKKILHGLNKARDDLLAKLKGLLTERPEVPKAAPPSARASSVRALRDVSLAEAKPGNAEIKLDVDYNLRSDKRVAAVATLEKGKNYIVLDKGEYPVMIIGTDPVNNWIQVTITYKEKTYRNWWLRKINTLHIFQGESAG